MMFDSDTPTRFLRPAFRRTTGVWRLILAAALIVLPLPLVAQDVPTIADSSPILAAPPQPEIDLALPQPDADSVAPLPWDPALHHGPIQPDITADPAPQSQDLLGTAQDASAKAAEFLQNGGPSIWVIAALSVITVALILWKTWRLALMGAWSRGKAGQAVSLFESGDIASALTTVQGRRGVRSKVVLHAIEAIKALPDAHAREEVSRIAKRELANAGVGLRALELIATIAPLLGLLGTVLGMIAAFQALQQSGNRADPALLAGGIWEALLTTAAGMAVAIPASAALTWFEAVIDRMRRDVEDSAVRLFVTPQSDKLKLAAE